MKISSGYSRAFFATATAFGISVGFLALTLTITPMGKRFMSSFSPVDRKLASASAGYVDLIVVPPYKPQQWSTPRKLLLSQLNIAAGVGTGKLFRKKVHKSGTGHGMVHFKCESSSGPVEEWSGFSGNGDGTGTKLVFSKRAGMGVLLYEFADGHVQTPEYVQKYIERASRVKDRQPRFLRLPISREQCDAMVCHLRAFRAKESPTYGFTPDPLRYEGAGCTSYAVSFLQIAGLHHPNYRRWIRKLVISSKLVASTSLQPEIGRLEQLDEDQPDRVRVMKILGLFRKSKWQFDGTRNYELEILDPQLMTEFVDSLHSCASGRACNDGQLLDFAKEAGARPFEHPNGLAVELPSLNYFDPNNFGNEACQPGALAYATPPVADSARPENEEEVDADRLEQLVRNMREDEFEKAAIRAATHPEEVPRYDTATLREATQKARKNAALFFYYRDELYTPLNADALELLDR